ncbi:hypothetical protein N825_07420 [Skermanella stibiiresistens SB22]|jgi:hypothetical protein|uniref:Uncharacterized protein n=1 Tax=Skermanella stibiiresistens SB22 TaxID=1385369 RepID=W9GZ20_9PROT|nr:hypothetical protein [Skermanella stibiiresistens]EWY39155.1 hypothetical protein N825_07420 [Skermanella stibiiresistens SB22]
MQDYTRYRTTYQGTARSTRSTGERFLAYLRTRSTETWVFFAAGLITGAFLG